MRTFVRRLAPALFVCAPSMVLGLAGSGCGQTDEPYKPIPAFSGRKASLPPVPTLPAKAINCIGPLGFFKLCDVPQSHGADIRFIGRDRQLRYFFRVVAKITIGSQPNIVLFIELFVLTHGFATDQDIDGR